MLTEKINKYADWMQSKNAHHTSDGHEHPHEMHEHDPTYHLFEFFRNQLLLEMNEKICLLAYQNPKYNNDKYIFQNYIFCNMVNVEFWSTDMKQLLAPIFEFCEKTLNKNILEFLTDWFDLAGNDNYIYKADDDWRKAKLYFHRLFIPIFVTWQINHPIIQEQIDGFNNLLKNEKLNYTPGQTYDYFNGLLIFNVIERKRKVLFEMIDYIKKIKPVDLRVILSPPVVAEVAPTS